MNRKQFAVSIVVMVLAAFAGGIVATLIVTPRQAQAQGRIITMKETRRFGTIIAQRLIIEDEDGKYVASMSSNQNGGFLNLSHKRGKIVGSFSVNEEDGANLSLHDRAGCIRLMAFALTKATGISLLDARKRPRILAAAGDGTPAIMIIDAAGETFWRTREADKPATTTSDDEPQHKADNTVRGEHLEYTFVKAQPYGRAMVGIQVKITNISARTIRMADVTCTVRDAAGKDIEFQRDYVVTEGLAPGASTHHTFLFNTSSERIAGLAYNIEELEWAE